MDDRYEETNIWQTRRERHADMVMLIGVSKVTHLSSKQAVVDGFYPAELALFHHRRPPSHGMELRHLSAGRFSSMQFQKRQATSTEDNFEERLLFPTDTEKI